MSTAKVFILLALLAKYLFYWSYGHKDASRWSESGLNEFSPTSIISFWVGDLAKSMSFGLIEISRFGA